MAFRGVVATIPAGKGSLNANVNRTEIPATDLGKAESIMPEEGAWRKIGGAAKFNADAITGTPAILAGFDWRPTSAIQKLVLAGADGKLYKEASGDLDSVTLKSGLSTTAIGRFVAAGNETIGANRKLIYFNGANAAQVLAADGATTADIAAPDADWATTKPSFGVQHHGRLFAGAGHNLYVSSPENHEDFACAQSEVWPVAPGVGEQLVCGVSHNNYLWVFKYPMGIYWLDDSDVRVSYWSLKTATEAVGVAKSAYAAVSIGTDVLFLSEDGGFHLLSAVKEGTGAQPSDLAEAMDIKGWLRDNINLARLNQVQSCWDEYRATAMFTLPKAGSTTNDLVLMFDFSERQKTGRVIFTYSYRDAAGALWTRRTSGGIERPLYGDYAGMVWLMDQSTRSKGTDGYLAQYQTADTDFAHLDQRLAGRKKNFSFLELLCNPKGTCTATVEIYLDGTKTETLSFNVNQRRVRKPIAGSGYFFNYLLKNSTAAEDFSIAAARVGFTAGAEGA